jgi:hypothetical protein
MNWLNFFLILLNIIRSEEDLINVKKVYLLENNFWGADNEQQIKTDKGFLCRVAIFVVGTGGSHDGFDYTQKTCYFLKYTNLSYAVLKDWMVKDIIHFLKSPEHDNRFLKFHFLFTDELILNHRQFKSYTGKKQFYIIYKLLEKNVENNDINMKCDGIEIRLFRIKERIVGFTCMELLKHNEYISRIDENMLKEGLKSMENDAAFELYNFKNYSECLESLKNFVKTLRRFKLVMDSDSTVLKTDGPIDTTTTLMDSEFIFRLNEKFNEDIKKHNVNCSKSKLRRFFCISCKNKNNLNDVQKTNEASSPLRSLFNICCDHLKDEMLKNNIFFPIGNKYDIDYYLKELYKQIFKSINCRQEYYDVNNPENNSSMLRGLINLFDCFLDKLQATAVRDLCESEYIQKYFSGLLGREVKTLEDYINVEKIVCDYHNMFLYIDNLAFRIKGQCVLFPYFQPIFNDTYNYRIIDGIEITVRFPAEFEIFKAFDVEGNSILMERNTDYFLDKIGRIYCTSEVLKKKNIYEIEIISSVYKFSKRFKIDEYLEV